MRRQRTPWYESDNPTTVVRGGTWRGLIWVAAVLAFAGVVSVSVWSIRVAISDVKGAGDQTRIVNDGRNRVNAQEWFAGQYGQIRAADAKLADAKANLDANVGKPDEAFWRTNYSGLRNRCIEMVNAYNAEALKVSRGRWIDPSLPTHIDDTDTTTDCKEPSK